jgi:rhamnosyl/mannosyltransferase
MEPAWRALADEMGVAARISWLGEAPDAELPALYHAADLFVLPASNASEAFGLVQVEAMAAGLPVISTELGTGTSYVNQDGVTGRVVAPRDSAALASAIGELMGDAVRRRAMGIAAQARVQAEFNLDVMVARVLKLYEDCVFDAPAVR